MHNWHNATHQIYVLLPTFGAVKMRSKTPGQSHHPIGSKDQSVRLQVQVPTDFYADTQSHGSKNGEGVLIFKFLATLQLK